MRIAAVFVGMPRKVRAADRQLVTAGAKSPVDSVFLGVDGFAVTGLQTASATGAGTVPPACTSPSIMRWKQAHGFDPLPVSLL
ncbi:MAG: hypothetical protein MZU91_14345 [Desulfosudis oleivorans]|nr:hypothetical protein [Desulfosudis oleivorans]